MFNSRLQSGDIRELTILSELPFGRPAYTGFRRRIHNTTELPIRVFMYGCRNTAGAGPINRYYHMDVDVLHLTLLEAVAIQIKLTASIRVPSVATSSRICDKK